MGTQGHHIERGVDILYGDAALCQSLAGCGPGGEGGVYTQGGQNFYGTFTGLIDNQTISQGYTNSAGGPVVAFASATWLQNSGNSNYNSLQVSAERRARDLTFLASYTYAHSLDDVSAKFDPRDPRRAYGPSSFDLRHNLALSYNWDLPFAHFFGSRRITTGWHITGISRFNTGTPVSVKSGGDFALTNIGLDYPTQIGPINKLDPHNASHTFFNTSAFASGLRPVDLRSLRRDWQRQAIPVRRAGMGKHGSGRGKRHENHRIDGVQHALRNVQRLQPYQLPDQRRRSAMPIAASSVRPPRLHRAVLVRSARSSSSS